MINHKGEMCPYEVTLCQEGYCNECELYQTATINLAEFTKKVQIKRDKALVDQVGSSKERRAELKGKSDAYDLVLNMLKGGN